MAKKDSMTPRERWEAVLSGKLPDRVPMFYRSTKEFSEKLLKYSGCRNETEFCTKYKIDNVTHIGPKYTGPAVPKDMNVYGCKFADIAYATGVYRECVYHPIAECTTIEEIDAIMSWPSADWYDYSEIKEKAKEIAHMPVAVGGWEPFLLYKYLRGEERSYMDLIEYPDIVHYIMGRLFDHHYNMLARTLEQAGKGIILYCGMGEDLGSQTSLMYSPKHIREFFFPYHKKFVDLLHGYNIAVEWHTDGAAREILPDLVELGVDMLDPVQWRCTGMEREGLKADFGNLVFHGAMDNQFTLPFGTVEEVRQEVRDNFRILGKGGRFILGPCHSMQPVGPPENAVAMYETCYEECWY